MIEGLFFCLLVGSRKTASHSGNQKIKERTLKEYYCVGSGILDIDKFVNPLKEANKKVCLHSFKMELLLPLTVVQRRRCLLFEFIHSFIKKKNAYSFFS